MATLVAAGRVAEALAVAEGTKSRLLAGLMGRGELPAPADLPADLVARERAAAERLRTLDARELAGHGRAPGSGGDRPSVAGRPAIVDALRAIWAEMAAFGPAAADYVALRKAKDGNGQYYGGGFFSGQYGNGTIVDGSTLWGGLRIAISPFVPAGTALVGAFRDAATLYGKGGVQVDMSNSHADNFTTNKVTLRAEVRKALATRVPAGFVKITVTAG